MTKTEVATFAEFYRIWSTVYADLKDVDKVSVLDHEPTLAKFAMRLPSHKSRTKYMDLRFEELMKGKSELDIMTTFLS